MTPLLTKEEIEALPEAGALYRSENVKALRATALAALRRAEEAEAKFKHFNELAQAHADETKARIAELTAAAKGVLRVADRKTDEFDALRAALQQQPEEPRP